MHEETSVAVAHGYAKVEGRPVACMLHSTVGLQHASMALYNAWADRVPIYAIVGAQLDATRRAGPVDWVHAVFDGPALVRDFTKWDDTPVSLQHFGESAVQAYKFAMTPPHGPVLLAVDQNLQEDVAPAAFPVIPRLPTLSPPRGDDAAVAEIARLLVMAEHPVIATDRSARTPAGLASLIELAEALSAAVIDGNARMNFPWRHPLNQTGRQNHAISEADVVLALELTDLYGLTQGIASPSAIIWSISSGDLYMKANYQNFQRLSATTLAVAADAEATLQALVEAVRRLLGTKRRRPVQARGTKLGELHQVALQESREAAALGWNDSPISTARMCIEVYEKIRTEDWALVSGTIFQNMWPQKLWMADRHYQYIGDSGAYGLGYLPAASLGAALAHRRHGRLVVAMGGDGDLMFSPGMLWTAAHHKIPLLYVVHNNRAYHQEVMYVQGMANRRGRGIDRAHIGNVITDPQINYAQLAASMGVYGQGTNNGPQRPRAGYPAGPCGGQARRASAGRCRVAGTLAMRSIRGLQRPVIAATLGLLLAAQNRVLAAPPQEAVARGRDTFMRVGCYACHGTRGAGGGWAGPALAPNPIPIIALSAQIRHPAHDMPAYSPSVLAEFEIGDIWAYLASITPGPRAADIPALNH